MRNTEERRAKKLCLPLVIGTGTANMNLGEAIKPVPTEHEEDRELQAERRCGRLRIRIRS